MRRAQRVAMVQRWRCKRFRGARVAARVRAPQARRYVRQRGYGCARAGPVAQHHYACGARLRYEFVIHTLAIRGDAGRCRYSIYGAR